MLRRSLVITRLGISGIEIRHRRGWSLMVEPGFEANHLRRLLAVLEIAW
jgi:hypothetical protein